ncbi:hypothetical protein ACE6H2_007971 [Prunus campanulata]
MVLGRRLSHYQSTTNMAINWVHADPYITSRVTNLLGTINGIHADPNITQRLPILWGRSIGSMLIPTSPQDYQSPSDNQLDPC